MAVPCIVRDSTAADTAWIAAFLRAHWGGPIMITRGVRHKLLELPALVAERDGERCGLLTYRIEPEGWEIASLNAVPSHQGTGTHLIEAVARRAAQAGCRHLRVITTNDNVDAYGIPIHDELELELRP